MTTTVPRPPIDAMLLIPGDPLTTKQRLKADSILIR